MLISYTFRGQEVDLDVTDRREPYEWHFFGMTADEYNALNVTGEEEEAISIRIGEVLLDQAMCANPFQD